MHLQVNLTALLTVVIHFLSASPLSPCNLPPYSKRKGKPECLALVLQGLLRIYLTISALFSKQHMLKEGVYQSCLIWFFTFYSRSKFSLP